jgi:hypothetical protein
MLSNTKAAFLVEFAEQLKHMKEAAERGLKVAAILELLKKLDGLGDVRQCTLALQQAVPLLRSL